MKMMNNERMPQEIHQNALAQILAAIPLIFWKAFFTMIAGLIVVEILARYYPPTSGISIFAEALLSWIVRVLVISACVIAVKLAYAGYLMYHNFRMKESEHKALALKNEMLELKNSQLRTKIQLVQQLPSIMDYAVQRGLNFEYEGMKVSNMFSNVHTLGGMPGTVEAGPVQQQQLARPRLTIEEICQHIERNSYKIFIGTSLTNFNPVEVGIKGRHIKVIGASQKGKSSMIAALIDIVARTHDKEYVQFAFMDKEYQTSRLFADIPHLLTVIVNDQPLKMHAKSSSEVVAFLPYLLQILNQRNEMTRTALAQEPLIIVYLEEFLRLKKELKAACSMAQDKEEALRQYTTFSFAIGQLAGLGLKLRMQLWIAAQMDYADKDPELQEAMVNITSGLSFCVKSTAAHAAGFYNTELLARNAQENKPGQAVCEMPDCNDLILAPDYDLEKRLLARELAEAENESATEEEYKGPYLLKSETVVTESVPAIRSATRRATLQDAIEVWNELGEMGRPRLRKELQARGLACTDDLSLKLLDGIKTRLENAR